ncbi:hypothetical protein LCGC14_0246110 [marine sediment metagenome]|uniref:Uncharacterized protein n=1 Tax=marine sediment metagenome TaxID=412755 RepID=A0A0F9U670_9ZZZZ
MSFDFRQTRVVKKTYTKEGGASTQNWDFRYKASGSKLGKAEFYISNNLYDLLDLENTALLERDAFDDDGNITAVALAVVPDIPKEDGGIGTIKCRRFMKGAKMDKTKKFSADVLESALDSIGVIDKTKEGNQYMTLNLIGKFEDAGADELVPVDEDEEGHDIREIVAVEAPVDGATGTDDANDPKEGPAEE